MTIGDHVYDVNTKQTGTLVTQPEPQDNGGFRMVADVRWDNGTRMTVFTDHIRSYKRYVDHVTHHSQERD